MSKKRTEKEINSAISRRKFLKFGSLAVGTVGMSILTGCGGDVNVVEPSGSAGSSGNLPSSWDDSADFVLVGFGGAGAMAAINIKKQDPSAKILFVEAGTAGGGSTKICGGGTHFGGGTQIQIDSGFTEDADEFYNYALAGVGEGGNAELMRVYADNAKAAYDTLVELGVTYSGFYTGYAASPAADYSLMYDNEKRPELMAKAGYTTPVPHAHFAIADTSAGLSRAGTFWRALETATLALSNVSVEYSARANELIVNGSGRVVGVAAEKDGDTKYYKASKAVLICSGGFINNDEMVQQFIPHAMNCFRGGSGRDRGDGIKMGQAIGADIKNMGAAEDYGPTYMNHPALVKSIAVTPTGIRFAPEDLGGSVFGRLVARTYPSIYLIFDHKVLAEIPAAVHANFSMETANTIVELAGKIGVPASILTETVNRYNLYATNGTDEQFQKDPATLQVMEAPFYAMRQTSQRVFTLSCGGLRVNAKTQVLKTDGSVIPGLYAAGSSIAHINAQYYLAGGGTAGAFTFGLVAGREMAEENSWE
ncbi:MAG: FAD-binding protein [Deferribacterales bacterium]